MEYPKVNYEACEGCGVCIDICPAGAISLNDKGFAFINEEPCNACKACVTMCPFGAIV